MITKTEMKDIPGRASSYNEQVTKDVMEFFESDWSACEVKTEKYKNVMSAANAYKEAIKRAHVGVSAITRGGRLFLIRT